jgi:hypothetical protein
LRAVLPLVENVRGCESVQKKTSVQSAVIRKI